MDINKKLDEANLTEDQKKLMIELLNSMLPNSNKQQDSCEKASENLLDQSVRGATEASTSKKSAEKQKTLDKFFSRGKSRTVSKTREKLNNPKVQKGKKEDVIPKSNLSKTCENDPTQQKVSLVTNRSCKTPDISTNNEDVNSAETNKMLTDKEICKEMFGKRSVVVLEKLDLGHYNCDVKLSKPVSKRKPTRPWKSSRRSPKNKSKAVPKVSCVTDERSSQDIHIVSEGTAPELSDLPSASTEVKSSSTISDSLSVTETKQNKVPKVSTCIERSVENNRKLRVHSNSSVSNEELPTVEKTNKSRVIGNKVGVSKSPSREKQLVSSELSNLPSTSAEVKSSSTNSDSVSVSETKQSKVPKVSTCIERSVENKRKLRVHSNSSVSNEELPTGEKANKSSVIGNKVRVGKSPSREKQVASSELSNLPCDLMAAKGSNSDFVSVSKTKQKEQKAKNVSTCIERSTETKRKLRVHSNASVSNEELPAIEEADKSCVIGNKIRVGKSPSREKQLPSSLLSNLPNALTEVKGSSPNSDSVSVSEAEQKAKKISTCIKGSAETKRKLRVHSSASVSNEELPAIEEADKSCMIGNKIRVGKSPSQEKQLVSELIDSTSPSKKNARNQRAKKELVGAGKKIENNKDAVCVHSVENLIDKPVTVNKTDNLIVKIAKVDEGLTSEELLTSNLVDTIAPPTKNLRNRSCKKNYISVQNPEISKDEAIVHCTENVNDKNSLTDKDTVDDKESSPESIHLILPLKRKLRNQSTEKEPTCSKKILEKDEDVHSSEILNNDKVITVKGNDKNCLTKDSAMDDEGSVQDKLGMEVNYSVLPLKRNARKRSAKKESTSVEKTPEKNRDAHSSEKLNMDLFVTVNENNNCLINDNVMDEEGSGMELNDLKSPLKRNARKRSAKQESTSVEKTPEKNRDAHSSEELNMDLFVTVNENNNCLISDNVMDEEGSGMQLNDLKSPLKRNSRKRSAKKESTSVEKISEKTIVHPSEELNDDKVVTVKKNDKNCVTDDNAMKGSAQGELLKLYETIEAKKKVLRKQSVDKESICIENFVEGNKDEASMRSNEKLNDDKVVPVQEIVRNNLTNENTMDYEKSTQDMLLVMESNDSIVPLGGGSSNKSVKRKPTQVERVNEISTDEVGMHSNEMLINDNPIIVKEHEDCLTDKKATDVKGSSQNEQFVSDLTDLISAPKRKQHKQNNRKNLNPNDKSTHIVGSEVSKKLDESSNKEKLISADKSLENHLTKNATNSSQGEQLPFSLPTDVEQRNLLQVSEAVKSSEVSEAVKSSEVSEAFKSSESNLDSTPKRRQSKRNFKSKNELITAEEIPDFNKCKEQHIVAPVSELATTDTIGDSIDKSPIERNNAEASLLLQNLNQNSCTKKRVGKTLNKTKNVSSQKKVTFLSNTELQNPGLSGDGSNTLCKSEALWSSCIIDEQVTKSPKSSLQISDINSKSHVRIKLTQLPPGFNSQFETTGKAKKRVLSREASSAPKKSKKSPRNTKLNSESSKITGLEKAEMQIAPSALVESNKLSIDVQVKNSGAQLSDTDKLVTEDSQVAAKSILLPETNTSVDEKDNEAFHCMQKICSSLGINLEELFRNPKLVKQLNAKQARGSDVLFFLQAHKLVNRNIVPSLHVHNFKNKLEETLHQLASNS